MPPIYSQSRADLYNHAINQPRDTVPDMGHLPDHLFRMLAERTKVHPVTCGAIVDHLAPTFEEARTLAVLRAAALADALDCQDENRTVMLRSDFPTEVIDYMFDLLPDDQPFAVYHTADIIRALRPSLDEVRKETRNLALRGVGWNSVFGDISDIESEDGTTWNPDDDDFGF
jgi:hypothetical protein